LPVEARSVAARLKRARRGSIGLFQAWEGILAGAPVLVVVSGAGGSEAAFAADEVIRLFEPCGLIDFGTAGALGKKWAIGRCAIVERAVAYRPPVLLPPQEEWRAPMEISETRSDPDFLRAARESLDLPLATVGCADEPVANPHLARYLSVAAGFDLADCESHSVLGRAAGAGVPAVGLRTVTDRCGRDVEEEFRKNARRALRGAAKLLEKYVGHLYETGLLR